MSYTPTWDPPPKVYEEVKQLLAENERLRVALFGYAKLRAENERLRERLAKEPWCEHCGRVIKECPDCHSALGEKP